MVIETDGRAGAGPVPGDAGLAPHAAPQIGSLLF